MGLVNLDVSLSWRDQRRTVRVLSKVAVELRGKAVRRGLDVATKPGLDAMKQLAPMKDGILRQSIGRKKVSKGGTRRLELFGGEAANMARGEQAVIIGPNKKVGGKSRVGIANLIEGGTKPHIIKLKDNDGLRLRGLRNTRGRQAFAEKIKHPGIRAHRFMERAYRAMLPGFSERFMQGVEERVDKIMRQTK